MAERTDLRIPTRDGVRLAAWYYPATDAPAAAPCVILSPGFGGQRAHTLPRFAERFAAAGLACLLYDHRGFGDSEGEPRLEADPFRQMHDMRDVVTFATMLDGVDPARIGLWGNSYSGGHVLVVAAVDRRVRCVVAVVPVTSGSAVVKRLQGDVAWEEKTAAFNAARQREIRGEGTQYAPQSTLEETIRYWAQLDPPRENRISVISQEMFGEYEPVAYVARIAPTPLLMVLTDHDLRVFTDLQLEAYAAAREPKRLVMLPGGHYDPYITLFEPTVTASLDWFGQHLSPSPPAGCGQPPP
ncbi:MAG: alpha/beta hydrolase [Acetobacteraceae bacterium]